MSDVHNNNNGDNDEEAAAPEAAASAATNTKPKRKSKRKGFQADPDEIEAPSYERKTERGGYAHTNKSKLRISQANKGNVPWNKGKNRSDDVKARIREGVQRRNRKILLDKLAILGMTEEEWHKKQKEIKYLRERLRRAKLKNNTKDVSVHDKNLKAMIEATTVAKTDSKKKASKKKSEEGKTDDEPKAKKPRKSRAKPKGAKKKDEKDSEKVETTTTAATTTAPLTTSEQQPNDNNNADNNISTMPTIQAPQIVQTSTGEFVVVTGGEIHRDSSTVDAMIAPSMSNNIDSTITQQSEEVVISTEVRKNDESVDTKGDEPMVAEEVAQTATEETTTAAAAAEPETNEANPLTNDNEKEQDEEEKEKGEKLDKEEEKEKKGGEKKKKKLQTKNNRYASQLFARYINWTPHPFENIGNFSAGGADKITKCPQGGPGGLICCQHCTDAYSGFLTRTSMDIDEQKTKNIQKEISEMLGFMETSRTELDSAHKAARRKPLPNVVITPGEQTAHQQRMMVAAAARNAASGSGSGSSNKHRGKIIGVGAAVVGNSIMLDQEEMLDWSITNATDVGPNPAYFASI